MSFPRYPHYKGSGVEWLGEVPEHWKTIKLGHLLKSAPCYGVLVPDFEQDGVPMLRITDMEDDNADRALLNTISHSLSAQYSRTIVEEGDVVLSVVGTIGKVFQVDAALAGVNLSRAVARLQLDDTITAEFACWIFQTLQFKRYVDLVCVGTAQRVLNMADLESFRIVNPLVSEQTQIALFLDRETAKIDGLVAEQQRLMELLKEKRQAVISHAVTKGLNPHVPMKPSGIEWLGEVPAHWEVMSLKRDLDFLTSGSRGWAENYSDEGELFIRITNLTRGSIGLDLSDIQRVAVPDGAEGSRTKVRPGDVLFSITAYLGSVAVVPDALENAYVSQHVALARLRQSRLVPKWVGFVALSVVGQTWFETKSYGGTKIQLSLDDVRDLPIPVPPVDEQHAVVAHLEAEVAKFDTLTAEAQRAIDLLQERRTALISAAVTGQIDVRLFSEKQVA